ncbi:MAG: pyrimidine-nucleoside phosphorylase [Oscillospiraceae bacterium]|nr:pyrimidine-nucleoside phosphorylase [Oscillospiraceae bacterium]
MLMTDLIAKKRDGGELSSEEIQFMIDGYVRGDIADYQMSAMCMAILWRGMSDRETLDLTMAMMHSGDVVDLSSIKGIKADKHSTGGVGDKTSLILCPMVAACGLRVAKMSGRGLGHTGGTLDKLESFPGYNISIGEKRFLDNVNRIGIAIMGQTADLVPADKKLYALRDVTGTVPSIPLIVSSIMSKKLASGTDVIVLDVKCGSGAFMKTEAQAHELARGLTRIGKLAGRKCAAVITDMNQPLGCAVGNALEVKEAISVLRGETKGDLLELCLTLGSCLLIGAGYTEDEDTARQKLQEAIDSGKALQKLAELVEAQDGDAHDVYDTARLPLAPVQLEVPSESAGYVSHIECEKVGLISMHLGGGRAAKEDAIDLSVGLVLHKKVGDKVEMGESLATIHASTMEKAQAAANSLRACCTFSDTPVQRPQLIKDILFS